ncbi:MAG: hypothetical protein ABEJ93_00810 [Candidatus Nanohalobium sp.]
MSLTDSIVSFSVGLVIGTAALHIASLTILGSSVLRAAAVTAFLGSAVWFIATLFSGWIPLLGLAAKFVTWFALLNARYPGNWKTAAKIAAVAWIASAVFDHVLKRFGFRKAHAAGIPGA